MLAGKPFSHFFYIRNQSSVVTPDTTPACILIRGGIDTVVAVTVTGTVDGGWVASGTIPSNWAVGDYVHLRVSATASGYPMTDTVLLGTIEYLVPSTAEIVSAVDSSSAKLAAIDANAKLASQGVRNRYKIDEDANTGTLYADDGVTPIVVQALKDKDGHPASTQTYERVPQ